MLTYSNSVLPVVCLQEARMRHLKVMMLIVIWEMLKKKDKTKKMLETLLQEDKIIKKSYSTLCHASQMSK